MGKKNISQEKIIQAFLYSSFDKSAGGTALSDVANTLEIKKASLYNHFESRDAIYESTLNYCKNEFQSVSFLSDKALDTVEKNKISIKILFKKLITRYYNLFENEPYFQIFVFLQTEKYFNYAAFEIISDLNLKLINDIKKIFRSFQKVGKLENFLEKDLQEISEHISLIIFQSMDFYLAKRKEIVRQNPDSGAGCLFALPTDNELLNKTLKNIELYFKYLNIV